MADAGVLTVRADWEDRAADGTPLGDLDVEVSFRSGGWQGAAVAFTQVSLLQDFASELRSFSTSMQGEVLFQAGQFGAGSVLCRFRPADRRGHIACFLVLEDSTAPGRQLARVSIELRTEPALLDAFVASLDRFLRDRT
jgi:hypothetical protein